MVHRPLENSSNRPENLKNAGKMRKYGLSDVQNEPADSPNELSATPNESADGQNDLTEKPNAPADGQNELEDTSNGPED